MKSPKNDKLNFSFLFLPLFNRGNRNGLAYPNEFLRKMVFFRQRSFHLLKICFHRRISEREIRLESITSLTAQKREFTQWKTERSEFHKVKNWKREFAGNEFLKQMKKTVYLTYKTLWLFDVLTGRSFSSVKK